MSAANVLATAALVSAATFAAFALYVTLVEHPARLASGAAAGRAQFRPSYQRAAPWQASLAVVALASGAAVAVLSGRLVWLAGALAVGAAIPFTLLVVRPVNHRLLGAEPLAEADVLRLLERWGRLHAVRTVLGAAGFLTFLYALRTR